MLIDDITIKISAGKGGDGVVGFDKNKFALGPTGARGGNGGNVYFIATDDIGALRAYRHQKNLSLKMEKLPAIICVMVAKDATWNCEHPLEP